MAIIGIYKITSPTNKIYVGQSIDIERRFRNYKKLNNCKGETILYRSLEKHGANNHKYEILEECTADELNEREFYYQYLFKCVGENGLNCIMTDPKEKTRVMTNETKNKLSKGNHSMARKVIDTSNGKIYDYIKQCAEDIGIGRCLLIQMLKGRRPNITTIRYLEERDNDKPKSFTYIVATNNLTKEELTMTIDEASLYFKVNRATILNYIKYPKNGKRKIKEWDFKYRDKEICVVIKPYYNKKNHSVIILDTYTGAYYYSYIDFAINLGLLGDTFTDKEYANAVKKIKIRIKNPIEYNEFDRYIIA